MRFSKVVLPLTPAQHKRAVEAYTAGMEMLTERELDLYDQALARWVWAIQEACCEADKPAE